LGTSSSPSIAARSATCPTEHVRVSAPQRPVDHLDRRDGGGAAQHRCRIVGEEVVDDAARNAFELGLRQRPQGHVLAPARQGLRLTVERVRRSGQQEAPGTAVAVDAGLDREDEVRYALHLVDDRPAAETRHEALRIGARARLDVEVVQRHELREPSPADEATHERALAPLSRTLHDDHGGVPECLLHQGRCPPWDVLHQHTLQHLTGNQSADDRSVIPRVERCDGSVRPPPAR
jgi:hypothetical protein